MSKIKFDFTSVEPQLEIAVTVFQNKYCSNAMRTRMQWSELCEMLHEPGIIANGKINAQMIKLATFGEERKPNEKQPDPDKWSLKHDGNVLKITGIEADYDAGVMPMEEAVKLLEKAGIRAVLYSSWGDGLIEPPKYLGGPRWRVIAPFSKELPPEQRAKMVARLNGALGGVLADESFTLAQGFFIGARPGGDYKCKVTFRDPQGGEPVDLLPQLDDIAIYKRNFSADDSDGERYSVDIKPGSVIVAPETYAELRAALAVIPADCDNFEWFSVLRGLSRLSNTMDAKSMARDWSTSSPNPEHTEAVFAKEWARMSRENTTISHRKIMWLANQYDPSWETKALDLETAPVRRRTSVLDHPIVPFSEEEAEGAELQPRVLVENYLFADLRNLIAAGGVGKTSMLLHEAVCGALGRPIWGNAVHQPFTTVFVTKEDSREILLARLREIMRTMDLSPTDRHTVYKHVFAVDLSGVPYKLAHIVGGQVEPHTANLDALVEHCTPVAPDRIIFDPLVSFTAGESRVNEAEQGVVEAARYLMRKLPGIAVDIVHHTGKMNARMGAMDQYAGRNGSALPDGSRMVAVMTACSADSFSEGTGHILDEHSGEKGLRLSFPKMSYAAQPADKYIKRCGFHFQYVASVTEEQRVQRQEARKEAGKQETVEAIKASIVSSVRESLSALDPLDRYPSRTRVLVSPCVTGKTATRKKSLTELLEDGVLVERNFTEDELSNFASTRVLAGRNTYVALPDEDL
jgi:RecA-family ATPase